MSFFDIVLDFILMDAFEDLENPPSSVLAVLRNRWLSDSFKETVGGPPYSQACPRSGDPTLAPGPPHLSVPGFEHPGWLPSREGAVTLPGMLPAALTGAAGPGQSWHLPWRSVPGEPLALSRWRRACVVSIALWSHLGSSTGAVLP